jgi:hypothetical protein
VVVLQIESLTDADLGPNFHLPAEYVDEDEEEEDERNLIDLEAEVLPKKQKTLGTPSKARFQGGSTTAALERKKKRALSPSPDEDEEALPRNVPIVKK